MTIKHWANPIFIGLLILLSLPIKLPALQQWIESIFLVSLPIKLSLYTLFLTPVAVLCLIWNRRRAKGIWRQLRWPLTIILFLFCWMWLGSITSDYLELSLKHSGRNSIFLLTFVTFLFALDSESLKNSSRVFSGIYIILMGLTFLDHYGQVSIVGIIENLGMKIDLFHSGVGLSETDWDSFRDIKDDFIFMYPTSFFEHRNPYAVVSAGMFFWGIYNLKHSLFFSSLVSITAFWSLVISGSRNGLFTLLFIFLILLILTARHSRNIFVFTLISTILLGIIISTIDSETINRTRYGLNQLTSVRSYKDLEKMDLRFTIYRISIEVGLKSTSIFGSGTKTSGHKMFDNSKDFASNFCSACFFPETRKYWAERYNSHNALLNIWIEMGWVGLFAVLIFLWIWFRPALLGPPLLMMPMMAVCVGQIFDYFVWEIFFMAFQSFFFAYFASSMNFLEGNSISQSSDNSDY